MKNTKIKPNLNKKKTSFLTPGTTSLKVPGGRDPNTYIPSKPSPVFNPLLGYPMKPQSLLNSFGFLGTPGELPTIPKSPVFLETSPAPLDQKSSPEKDRKVEASILRFRSKVKRGTDKLRKFLTLLEDGDFRTHEVSQRLQQHSSIKLQL